MLNTKGDEKMANTTEVNLNPNHEWHTKPEAKRLDVQVFFRGLGGDQDTILTLVKLKKAGYHLFQYNMIDGMSFERDDHFKGKRISSGEATIGFTTYFMPKQKNFVEDLYKTLMDDPASDDVAPKDFLEDYDQYIKIQVRHKVDNGKWSDWTCHSYYAEEVA